MRSLIFIISRKYRLSLSSLSLYSEYPACRPCLYLFCYSPQNGFHTFFHNSFVCHVSPTCLYSLGSFFISPYLQSYLPATGKHTDSSKCILMSSQSNLALYCQQILKHNIWSVLAKLLIDPSCISLKTAS